jgi:hypothetical protein
VYRVWSDAFAGSKPDGSQNASVGLLCSGRSLSSPRLQKRAFVLRPDPEILLVARHRCTLVKRLAALLSLRQNLRALHGETAASAAIPPAMNQPPEPACP